jgi:hypothetical protein
MSNKNVFDQLLAESSRELFRARGIDLQAAAQCDTTIEYAAVIGFASDKLRGMVGIGVDPSTLTQLASEDRNAGPQTNAEDWLAESVNQLVGRLKNKLLGYGAPVGLALPTLLRGVRLQFLARRPETLSSHAFQSPAGLVHVWLDVQVDPALVLKPTGDPEMQSTPEGEVVLF